MKGKIDVNGNLWILRGRYQDGGDSTGEPYKKQLCAYKVDRPCGAHCPLFGTPKRVHGGITAVTIKICQDRTLSFYEFNEGSESFE